MKNLRVLMIIALISLGFAGSALAEGKFQAGNPERITGIIVKLGSNWLEVKDENSISTYRFFISSQELEGFQAGERVRVTYALPGWTVVSLRRMTVLQPKEGQNLGYFQ